MELKAERILNFVRWPEARLRVNVNVTLPICWMCKSATVR